MAEPYSRPQNDLPPPLPQEPDETKVPTVQSDPPGYKPPAPAASPAAPTPPLTFTPPAAQPRSTAQPTPSVPLPAAEQPVPPPAPRPPKRGLRSLFWPGFVAGFMLLAGMSCGGVVVATGISRINLADLQDSGSSWTPPPVTPTPLVAGQTAPAGEAQDSGNAGNVVRNITSSNVNIRATPGYLSKPAGDVVAQVRPGESLEILGERTQADNLIWWRIRYQPGGGAVVEGWVAEATASGVQILGR